MSKPGPLAELLVDIGRSTDPEALAWLAGAVERWSKRARGLEPVEDCFDQIAEAVKARLAELAGTADPAE